MTNDLPLFAPLDPLHVEGKVTRWDVVVCARAWIGTPYQHQHRARGIGVDCAGLVIGVARDLGLVAADFDVTGYAPTPDGTTLIAECDRWMRRIHVWDLRPGNVLVVNFGRRSGFKPQHMGIVGDYMHGGLSLIQALGTADGKGEVIESRLHERSGWRHVQGYELPGIFEPGAA